MTRYNTAERVSERLTDMSKDLTTMIEEINDVSSTISKTGNADDPVRMGTLCYNTLLIICSQLSKIIRVLNSHLSQLQLVDQGAAALQAKVTAARKESRRLGQRGNGILGTSAADDFYRSYIGRS